MEIAESMEVTLTHNDFQYMNYDLDEDNDDDEEEEVLPLEDSENGNEFVISVIGQPNGNSLLLILSERYAVLCQKDAIIFLEGGWRILFLFMY